MWGECSGNLAKASVSVAWDEKIRNGEPGREECGTDHLSVIGAGGRKRKRYELFFPGTARDCLKVWRDASGGAVCMFY
jgi:hypothetical protein